jgi:F0F1-type ATP synthase membrane subunit c/vacuolar-type H+-ATPase subunit K
MDIQAAKFISAALSLFAVAGVALGVSHIFSTFIKAIARNPGAQPQLFKATILGFAVVEFMGLCALAVAFLILFN